MAKEATGKTEKESRTMAGSKGCLRVEGRKKQYGGDEYG